MEKLQSFIEAVGVSVVLTYFIFSTIKLKQMKNEIETLKFEQDKLNFRLFVAEKTQKVMREERAS